VIWYHLSPKEEADMGKKYIVDLKRDEQKMLTGLIASGTQHVRKINHAHILLKADGGWTDQKISEALNVSVPTIERVRQQFVEKGIQQALSSRKRGGSISN
jgi:exosome complex RNA-binding protein Rrp42 (RNase PH superfamily)